MAREPRAVRKAREELESAQQTKDDTKKNYAEMRRFLMNTSQSHQGVRSENQANRRADKGVTRAEKALGEARKEAAIKAAKKEAKKAAKRER